MAAYIIFYDAALFFLYEGEVSLCDVSVLLNVEGKVLGTVVL